MTALFFVPIVLSLVVLGAHFLRGGSLLVVVALLAVVALLPLRRPWVARVAQAILALGALEWARTLIALTTRRMAQGEPYSRMVSILAVVAAVTLASALLFESARLRKLYGLDSGRSSDSSGD